jgi:predicted  nucleic acid-binding Zn-ribbon protein
MHDAMEKPTRLRRRMAAGMRGVVTFIAKRVTPRPRVSAATVNQPLLQAPTRGPKFREWLPATLAVFMTLLTLYVAWSVTSRLPAVFADTGSMASQIQELEQQLHSPTKTPEQQEASEEAIGNLRNRENKLQQERTRLNEKVAALEDGLDAARKREQELRDREEAEERKLEQHRKDLSERLGREIQVHPGPPMHYDAGPEPKAPWYGETLGYYVVGGKYRRRWNAWRDAKVACDAFNAFQRTTGVELVAIQGQVESINHQIDGFNEKLSGLNRQATDLARQLERYTAAPWDLWDDLNVKRKQLARTSFARWMFLLLDIPTLLSCLLSTAVAYSRMFLIAGRFGPRQLARSPE